MEDEKGLDLSLGLPCGGNSSSQKGKYSSSSDVRSDEGDRGSKLINEFKNFLEGGNQQHPVKVGEKFFNNFANAAVELETSKNPNTGGTWLTNDSRSTEIEDDNISSVSEKRKNKFTEANQQKKHERDANHTDLTDKTKASHISITTDEGSTADNEDVAESEVDGSTSRHVSQNDDVSRRFVSSGSLSRAQKEVHDSSDVEILGQKRFTISSEKEFNVVNMPMPYSVPFPGQPVSMNVSCSQPVKDSNASATTSLSSYPLPSMIHGIAATNGERTGFMQQVMPANFPLMLGYNPVQLPALDRDNSRGIVSHHQQIHPTYSGRDPVNPDTQNDSRKITQDGKSYGKHQVSEEGEGDLKKANPATKDASAESIPSEFPAIRPGIGSDLKFGGCGSYPNLPWVSTTGQGPNGQTISGVTYRYSPTQIRIVCACHGSHMSPEEFVRHAEEYNNTPQTDAAASALTSSFPTSNPPASAQS